MVGESVTVKGTPVCSLQQFIESELTAEQRVRLDEALPPEYATRFRVPVLATETVPVHVLNVITEEAARAKEEPLESFARRAGRAAASDAVTGIYRFFALVLTPAVLLSKASQMWSTLYNRGRLEVVSQSENAAHIRLNDFPSEPAGCARISGWIERLAEMTGAKDIEVRKTECVAHGAKACEWQLDWR